MRVNAIKLKDIAKALGISISTVSRALKDHPDVKPETIKAAKELAEFLHINPTPTHFHYATGKAR